MRIYELARELGVSNEQVKVWGGVNVKDSSSASVPKDVADVIRRKAVAAANTPAPTVTTLPREDVQKAIDKIVDEYGWDWCSDGVEEVNEILNPLGLTVTKFYDTATIKIAVTVNNSPSGDDYEKALAQKIGEVVQDLQWSGRAPTLRLGRYGESAVAVDVEED